MHEYAKRPIGFILVNVHETQSSVPEMLINPTEIAAVRSPVQQGVARTVVHMKSGEEYLLWRVTFEDFSKMINEAMLEQYLGPKGK